eukprot:gb/GECG01002165.1/.p1 GENE.gb/GECG01002165.1/~~gb/GECG01002165.1/.p1  ORF type:complete len:268 (+),score=17.56 gb/GECG01002165.1/:1-804(+)
MAHSREAVSVLIHSNRISGEVCQESETGGCGRLLPHRKRAGMCQYSCTSFLYAFVSFREKMPQRKEKGRSTSGDQGAQAKSSEKHPRMSSNLLWQWRLYHRRRFFWYRLFAGLIAGMNFLLTAFATALPAWLLAEVPQQGRLRPGRAGLFNFCLDEDPETTPVQLISQDKCSTVKWVLRAQNEEVSNDVSTIYILYTVSRIAMLFLSPGHAHCGNSLCLFQEYRAVCTRPGCNWNDVRARQWFVHPYGNETLCNFTDVPLLGRNPIH